MERDRRLGCLYIVLVCGSFWLMIVYLLAVRP